LFIQEPPWRLIRRAPSAKDPEGERVVGAPNHPSWTIMVRPQRGEDDRPRVATYVSKRLASLRPAMRRDVIDHCDILIMSLFYRGSTECLANVYSDDNGTAIQILKDKASSIPALSLMAGDFNCHSPLWDPGASRCRGMADTLLETAGILGVALAGYTNPGPTFIS
jgi:hypothetical protein